MAIITIQGYIASGGEDLAPLVAQKLGYDYVDRVLLAEAGKRVGATVEALVEKEQRISSVRERLARLFQRALEHSAYASGDPFFGVGLDTLLSTPYPEEAPEPATQPYQVDDARFFRVICEVIRELAQGGNMVILGRGACLILKDVPKTLHVRAVAPYSFRVQRFMQRENIQDRQAAERALARQDKARLAYFARHFKVNPDDSTLYHMVVNLGSLPMEKAAEVIVRTVPLL